MRIFEFVLVFFPSLLVDGEIGINGIGYANVELRASMLDILHLQNLFRSQTDKMVVHRSPPPLRCDSVRFHSLEVANHQNKKYGIKSNI